MINKPRHARKSALKHAQNVLADSDHVANVQSVIRAFALHLYILRYPMILLADSKGPD